MALLTHYKVITVTHHHLNVNEIGHFFLRGESKDEKSENLRRIQEMYKMSDCMYLETCNRVTFIMYADDFDCHSQLSSFFMAVNPNLEAQTLANIRNFVSVYEGEAAIKHVFELTSSMDSLVVGEREIFRQFREAYEWSREKGHISDNLRLLEKATVRTAKKIYHNTKIGEKPLSVVSLAVSALMKTDVPRHSKVLLVGAGETNALVAKFLKKYEFSDIKIYNRSLHNAAELSEEIGAEAYHIHDLTEVKGKFDIMFVCTSASKAIIDVALYKQMLAGDTSEKVIIDLAVPRNVTAEVVSDFNVRHIDIEDLKKLSEENLEFRKSEMEKARPMIQQEVVVFNQLFNERQIEKAMSHIPSEILAVKQKAIQSVFNKRIDDLDEDAKSLVLEMMDYMEKKCVAVPIKLAKQL